MRAQIETVPLESEKFVGEGDTLDQIVELLDLKYTEEEISETLQLEQVDLLRIIRKFLQKEIYYPQS